MRVVMWVPPLTRGAVVVLISVSLFGVTNAQFTVPMLLLLLRWIGPSICSRYHKRRRIALHPHPLQRQQQYLRPRRRQYQQQCQPQPQHLPPPQVSD